MTFQRWAGTSSLPAAQVTYRYDALGRRIARVENGTETRFVYDGGRVIEERRGADDSVLASYVHGAYIDDVVTMRRAVPQGGIPADWFFHSDDQFSVSAVTNAAGALAERVAYGDFGAPTFLSPGGVAMVVSAIGNPYAFTGRRWDAAERTYHYRFRTFSPGLGRFTTRDPIGIWGDALNLGNGYTYTGNDPWTWVDPWGLQVPGLQLGFTPTGCPRPVPDSTTTGEETGVAPVTPPPAPKPPVPIYTGPIPEHHLGRLSPSHYLVENPDKSYTWHFEWQIELYDRPGIRYPLSEMPRNPLPADAASRIPRGAVENLLAGPHDVSDSRLRMAEQDLAVAYVGGLQLVTAPVVGVTNRKALWMFFGMDISAALTKFASTYREYEEALEEECRQDSNSE